MKTYTLHPWPRPSGETPSAAPWRQPRRVGADYAPEAGSGPLTLHQKRRLVLLAKRAWMKRGQPGENFDLWRRDVAERACGHRISQAWQRDWGSLKAAFENELGESGWAMNTLMRDEDNKRRIALHQLGRACSERGLPLAYPEAICRRQYRCGLGDATASQLWRLFFTVKNRRKKS